MYRHKLLSLLLASWTLFAADYLVGQESELTVDNILQKYVRALGGEETLNSVSSMKMIVAQTTVARDDKDEATTQSIDTILVSDGRWMEQNSLGGQHGFDGTRYWSKPKHGKLQWNENRYPFNDRDPVSYPLHLLDFPGTFKFDGKTDVDGKPAYRVAVTPSVPEPSGRVRMTPTAILFDSETGLLVQVLYEHKTVVFSDYRDVEGLMVPFEQNSNFRLDDLSSEHEKIIQSIEFNVMLDERQFIAPDDGAGK